MYGIDVAPGRVLGPPMLVRVGRELQWLRVTVQLSVGPTYEYVSVWRRCVDLRKDRPSR